MPSEYGANVVVSGSVTTFDSGSHFNMGSADVDFRVESDGNSHMLYVDGGNNYVGIGDNSPISALSVAGKLSITSEVSTPSAPADGHGWLYTKSDGKIYWQSNDVAETDLTSGGSSADRFIFNIPYRQNGTTGVDGNVYTRGVVSGDGHVEWVRSLGAEWTGTKDDLDVNNVIGYYGANFIIPVACEISNILVAGRFGNASSTYRFGVYKCTASFPADGIGNTTHVGVTRCAYVDVDIGSANNVQTFSGSFTEDGSNNTFAKGDVVLLGLVPDGGTLGNTYTTVTVEFQTT